MKIQVDRDGFVFDVDGGLLLGKVEKDANGMWWAVNGRRRQQAQSRSFAIELLKARATR